MTSTALEQRSPAHPLIETVRSDTFKEQIALVLPEDVTPDRFARVAATALLQNPDLSQCEDVSVYQALLRAAQDGLLPDGREAALVTFNSKVKEGGQERWVKKAQYLPMIGGYRKIAAEHGWALRTAVVYDLDEFDHELGLTPRLRHVPVRPGADRGQPIAAYAVARHRDGRLEFEVLTAAEIEKVRQASRAKDHGPWKDWPERMWEKTAGRRLFAKLPLDANETQTARIRRIVEELDADSPAAALFGRRPVAELVEASPGGIPAEDAAPTRGADVTQSPAGGAPPADDALPPESEPGPAVGADGEASTDEPGPAQPSPDQDAQAAADAAAAFNPGSSKWPGKTIGEIFHDGGDEGRDWIRWCVKNARRPEFVQAVRDFAAVYMPEALQ